MERHRVYWRRALRWTLGLLTAWLLVTLAGPWFARDLSFWHLGGFPFSYWMASQGALLLYLAIVIVYAIVMDRLDRQLLEDDAAAEAAARDGPAARDEAA